MYTSHNFLINLSKILKFYRKILCTNVMINGYIFSGFGLHNFMFKCLFDYLIRHYRFRLLMKKNYQLPLPKYIG